MAKEGTNGNAVILLVLSETLLKNLLMVTYLVVLSMRLSLPATGDQKYDQEHHNSYSNNSCPYTGFKNTAYYFTAA